MLNLIRADWKPVFVDFFGKGGAADAGMARRSQRDGRSAGSGSRRQKLTQSGVILTYLAERPGNSHQNRGRPARSSALDHVRQPEGQRLSRALSLPALISQSPPGDPDGAGISERPHRQQSRPSSTSGCAKPPFLLGDHPTIADISMCAYHVLSGRRIRLRHRRDHPNIGSWLERIKALPGWAHPYDLMPGHPLPGRWHQFRRRTSNRRSTGNAATSASRTMSAARNGSTPR